MLNELRKLSVQFVMHKSMTSQDYVLHFIAHIVEMDEKQLLGIAERFLEPAGGDGW